jgi:serine phosphatase RsbU (regulator of sigma subunit)/CHASE3 domain sensor protein
MLLRRRLLLLFVAVLVGVLAFGIAIVLVVRERDMSQARERALSVALERSTQLATAYVDQETSERGYALTGESSFLQPYTDGGKRAARLIRELEATPGVSTNVRSLVTAVGAAGERWRVQAAERDIALRNTTGAAAAATSIASGTGKSLFDSLRARLAALGDELQRADRSATNRLDDVRITLNVLLIAFAIVAVVGVLLAAWLIRRWVERPIDELAAEVRRVRAGSLDSPINQVGPPELADLALDIDAMRGRIREQLVESERSREAVEQSAAVVLTLRSNLESDVGPLPHGWSVAAKLRAAQGVVAGDCYDVFTMKDGRLALLVVDIAGHGATEGILALRCKEVLRAALNAGAEPGDAIGAAADQLGDMGLEVFLTTLVATIDSQDGHVRYANAGHPPAYIVEEDAVRELGPTGPIVGLLAPGWSTQDAHLPHQANLCAYTDGLIETRGPDQEFFGPERLIALLQGARCDEAPAVVKRCIDEVELFAHGDLRDDVTIVVLCSPEVT